jgi:antitoxin (DNA-binding transcriptional repressor) of toxin-antitoxin stability system
MSSRVVHVSESEALNDFASLLERVRGGDEVVIENDARPVAVLRAPEPARPLDEVFSEIAAQVPDAEWERIPTDLAKNLDYYLYGSSKTS